MAVGNRNVVGSVVIALVLLASVSLGAREIPATDRDPDGSRHAELLREAFEKAGRSAKEPSFLAVFEKNPNLTRRAFVSLVERWKSEPEEAKVSEKLCTEAAELCQERFGDHLPQLILSNVRRQSPDADALKRRYTTFLLEEEAARAGLSAAKLKAYGPYFDSYSVLENPSDYLPQELAARSLAATKAIRYKTAYLLENLPLMSAERDTLSNLQARLATLAETRSPETGGLSEKSSRSSRFLEEDTAFYERHLSLELGLIDLYKPGSDDPQDDPLHFSWRRTMLFLTCGWVAADQARLSILKEMLNKASEEMAQDVEVSRHHVILHFVRATLEYRLRRLEGFNPSPNEVFEGFQKAFLPLEAYRPMVRASVDATWLQGRLATRYWLDELARLSGSEQQISCLLKINETWYRWWERALERQITSDSRTDLILNTAYVEAFYSLGPNFFDQLTYRWIKFPSYVPDREDVQWVEGALEVLPRTITWLAEEETGAGFPVYHPENSGLLPELKSRLKLVEARMPDVGRDQRVALLKESLILARAAGQPSVLATRLNTVGREYQKLGLDELATSCWLESEKVTEGIPLVEPAFESCFFLAQQYSRRREWERAAYYGELALVKLENFSPLVGARSPEARQWDSELASIIELAAKAQIASQSPEKALLAVARGSQLRSAALQVEVDTGARRDVEALRRQQQEVSAVSEQVARLEAQPESRLRDDLLVRTRELLADSKAQFLTQTRELRQKHSSLYAQALNRDPLELSSLQKEIPGDAAVLQFFPTEETLYIFVVTRDTLRLRSVAISSRELDQQVLAFLRALRRHVEGDPQFESQARDLYDILIKPTVEDLQNKTTLVLIPTGRLRALPFACLTNSSGKTLIEERDLVEVAKPTDLTRLGKTPDKPFESVVAFANATGDLPAAQMEGNKVVSMFPEGKLFVAEEATRANLLAWGASGQVLHLATHAEWNLEDSLNNHLSLSNSEVFGQEEIFQLALEKTSIVVLSACNTAMGDGSDGGYVASLAEAFWLAGARSVLASLWPVDDNSTSLLMETFYRRLRAGEDRAAALRAAQLAVMSQPGYKHPYYWAGFVLFGERR